MVTPGRMQVQNGGVQAHLCTMNGVLWAFAAFSLLAVVPLKTGQARIPYALSKPTAVFTLPASLREVSALTDVNDSTVACVQDELAEVHFLSLRDGRITRSFRFGGPADMEGLTRVGDGFFALRSDGLVYRLDDVEHRLALLDTFRVDLPNKNIEGLGYDERTGRVLVSPKDFEKGTPDQRDKRVLYAFDPKVPGAPAEAVLELSLERLLAQARTLGIATPRKTTDKGKEVSALKLRYSSVAMHPITDHYYLLSAVDRTLLVVDRKGALIDLQILDAALLPKPEGITFMANGDLVLSSEGKGRTPVLVRYALRH